MEDLERNICQVLSSKTWQQSTLHVHLSSPPDHHGSFTLRSTVMDREETAVTRGMHLGPIRPRSVLV